MKKLEPIKDLFNKTVLITDTDVSKLPKLNHIVIVSTGSISNDLLKAVHELSKTNNLEIIVVTYDIIPQPKELTIPLKKTIVEDLKLINLTPKHIENKYLPCDGLRKYKQYKTK